jgi:hypothetical protein
MSARSRQAANEHPLEALHVARDVAQRAAARARHVGMLSGEQVSYETVLGDLLEAVGELSSQYRVTFPAEPATGRGGEGAADRLTVTALLRSLPDQLAQVRGGDASPDTEAQGEGELRPHEQQRCCC